MAKSRTQPNKQTTSGRTKLSSDPDLQFADPEMVERINRMRQLRARAAKSKSLARKILMATGFYTPTGKLKKRFQQP